MWQGHLFHLLNIKIMEAVFIDHLDQIYWNGYGEEFKADNPVAFYRQLAEFKNQHRIV